MRRGIQLSIGILEAILACVLFVIGWQLPRSDSVECSFARVEHVTRTAETQVRTMREQLAEIRRQDFPRVAAQLGAQTRVFSARLTETPIDFPTVDAMNNAVAASALGLEDWSAALNPRMSVPESQRIRGDPKPRANSLASATFRARTLLELCASHLELGCRALHTDLGKPIDAAVLIQLVDTVERIRDLSRRMQTAGRPERLADVRLTMAELESTLESAHRQVKLASTAALPLLIMNGTSQPIVQMVPLWPDGKQAEKRLGSALGAVRSTNRQLDEFARLVCNFRARMPSEHNDCGSAPMSSGTLIECAGRMRSLAGTLRRTVDALERIVPDWPNLAETMRAAAWLLRGLPLQLDGGLLQKSEYDRAVRGSRQVTETAEDLVQTYSGRLDRHLNEQEQSLAEMERGLGEASTAIPVVANTAVELLTGIRWMFWLVGALMALHGTFVMCEARLKPLAA